MKRYDVVVEESAQADVRASYDWGCRIWGKRDAQRWVRDLRTSIFRQLSLVPRSSTRTRERRVLRGDSTDGYRSRVVHN